MKEFNNTMAEDFSTSQSNLIGAGGAANIQQQQGAAVVAAPTSGNQSVVEQPRRIFDELNRDLQYLSHEAPLDGAESTFGAYSTFAGANDEHTSALRVTNDDEDSRYGANSPMFGFAGDQQQQLLLDSNSAQQLHVVHDEASLQQLAPDNVDIRKPLQHVGFLVSFLVDARGGAMRGCRHSGVRVIIPPNTAPMPMRITCRYLRRERLVHPPPLMEGEACASKIMEVGPAGAKFLGPVLIEVPHFASLRGKEREIIILRSDSGEVWREHTADTDELLVEQIIKSAEQAEKTRRLTEGESEPYSLDNNSSHFVNDENATGASGGGGDDGTNKRVTRIVATEFPQYFAIISRIRQEVFTVGPDGLAVDSQVVPRVQATFTEGALTKRIKIGLQPKNGKKHAGKLEETEIEIVDETRPASRAQTPAGQSAADGQQRPHSAASQASAGKRRSKFLACFGSAPTGGAHSDSAECVADQSGLESSNSSAGGNSPKHQRTTTITPGTVVVTNATADSQASSPQLDARRREQLDLVPEDYYIEREPPFLLTKGPKTYGKRLASCSVQTDQKLAAGRPLSTSARNKRTRRPFSLPGRRRTKAQMNIRCSELESGRPKSLELADSSLEPDDGSSSSSLIADVVTSNDHKWRTCTIQTDSDSVTVNYVTASFDPMGAADTAGQVKPAPHSKSVAVGQDDGYVSGSGDLKSNRRSGLFSCASTSKDDDDAAEATKDDAASADAELARLSEVDDETATRSRPTSAASKTSKKLKASAKSEAKKAAAQAKDKTHKKSKRTEKQDKQQTLRNFSDESTVIVSDGQVGKEAGDNAATAPQQTHDAALADVQDSSVASSSVVAATAAAGAKVDSKEEKRKLKLDLQKRLQREKDEQRQQRELDEAALRAKKLAEKEEKEAKKRAAKAQKLADKAKKAAALAVSRSQSPASVAAATGTEPSSLSGAAGRKAGQSVTFASTLIDSHELSTDSPPIVSRNKDEPATQQDLSRDMVRLSIGDATLESTGTAVLVEQAPKLTATTGNDDASASAASDQQQLISFSSDSACTSASASGPAAPTAPQQAADTSSTAPLRPILKQQSSTTSQDSATQRALVADELVDRATAEAVTSLAESSLAASSERSSSLTDAATSSARPKKDTARVAKLEKQRLREFTRLARQEESANAQLATEASKRAEKARAAAERLAHEAEKAKQVALAEAQRAVAELAADNVASTLTAGREQVRAKFASKQAHKSKSNSKKTNKETAKQKQPPLEQPLQTVSSCALTSEKQESHVKSTSDSQAAATSEPIDSASDATKLATASSLAGAEEPQQSCETNGAQVEVVESVGELANAGPGEQQAEANERTGATAGRAHKKEKEHKRSKKNKSKTKPHGDDAQSARSHGRSSSSSSSTAGHAQSEPAAKVAKQAKTKPNKDTKSKSTASDDASKSSGLLGRLLWRNKRSAAKHERDIAASAAMASAVAVQQAASKPVIVSEMYPSDPNDADGEMILEVNVPEHMIESSQKGTRMSRDGDTMQQIVSPHEEQFESYLQQQQQQQQQQQHQLATQIGTHETSTASKDLLLDLDDQEATLVNISQLADEAADETTENVLSQADDVQAIISSDQPTVAQTDTNSVGVATTTLSSVGDEAQQIVADMQQTSEPQQRPATLATTAAAATVVEDEKQRRELDAKLAKEAKRQAKEEEKLRKLQHKADKQRAKAEYKQAEERAKREAKEQKERLKREAQNAKRAAEQAKKEAKAASKAQTKAATKTNKKSSASETVAIVASASAPAPAPDVNVDNFDGGAAAPPSSDEAHQDAHRHATVGQISIETNTSSRTGNNDLARECTKIVIDSPQMAHDAQPAGDDALDTSRMSPVKEELEVERIVEEVVGPDGTVTKTTKVVETKYVTLRGEETTLGELSEIPLEQWHQMQAAQAAATAAERRRSRDSSESGGREIRVINVRSSDTASRQHEELKQLCSTRSYFDPATQVDGIKPTTTPKKAWQKRVKLNQKLIKRALKLAKRESCEAKKGAKRAAAEIAVCDEAARVARKQLKVALKQAHRAERAAHKLHKQMDKVDKKLAKRAKALEKSQRKVDKKVAKLNEKTAQRQAKWAKRAAKEQERSEKLSRTGSKKSIKLEDIGEPVLRTSSRVSLAATATAPTSGTALLVVDEQQGGRNQSLPGDELHVQVSIEDAAEAALASQTSAADCSLQTNATFDVSSDEQSSGALRAQAQTMCAELDELRNETSRYEQDEQLEPVSGQTIDWPTGAELDANAKAEADTDTHSASGGAMRHQQQSVANQ